MNLVLTVFEIVTPVFLLGALGFFWVRLGFEYRIEFVTRLSMTFAIPCLIFVSLMQSDITPEDLSTVLFASIAGYGFLTMASFIIVKVLGLEIRSFLLPLILGNTGNLGLPLAYFAYGDQGLGYALVIFAVSGIYGFTFGVWVVSGGGSLMKVVKEPLVGATVLGALFLWQGWETPLVVTRTLDLTGQMGIPLMLITLGVAVARLRPANLGLALWLSVLRVILWVGIAWGTAHLFGLSSVAFGVLVLQLSTPMAVTSYMLAAKYGADSERVAGLVVVSTVLAIISLPITLAFLI